jgi:uncharacterized protein (UPF0332 family)
MSVNRNEKDQLIRQRLEQAKDTEQVVELLITNEMYPAAVNRIYYGVFYSLLALGLEYNFETSKHQQLIGWFNREFIKKKKIEFEYGKILKKAYENRTSGDYDVFCEFEKEDVLELFENMKRFVRRIEKFIQKDRS